MMPHVFVYGTLRCGGRNDIARYRPEPRFIGEASIAGTLFYPGVVLGGAQRVKGEVYAIEPAVETALDVLEEVADDDSGEYIKRQVRVEVHGQWFDCLVYEIHPTRIAGLEVIESGDWIAHAARSDAAFSQPKD